MPRRGRPRVQHTMERPSLLAKKKLRITPQSTNVFMDMPESLAQGSCVTPIGLANADKGQQIHANAEGIRDREVAKQQCRSCIAQRDCLLFVLKNEEPAGTWGGVWGGLDPFNRIGKEMIQVEGGTDFTLFDPQAYLEATP